MDRLKRIGWRGGAAAALVILVGTAAAYAAPRLVHGHRAEPRTIESPPTSADTLRARFAVLSHQHSNRCGMPASALDAMSFKARLQGSCCFPMDFRSYVNQVGHLTRYAGVDVIPKDPYDVPVSLAKLLIAYQSIELTAAQQRTYDRAIPLSSTKGPCCCRCWRWTAFGGQAKYLITQRRYSAKQIAEVWSLEEGCGGPSHRA